MKVFNMADEVEAFLDEFRTFLSRLPHAYEQLRLNQFTQALEIADNMLSTSERTCSLCVIFLFLFECREDEISHEIVEKLQNLIGQYEQFTRRYRDVIQNLQEQETDNRFRCQNEPAFGENLRGRPRFRVTKAQIESLREIGFSWTKIAELIGVSRVTLYRRRRELGIGEQHNYSELTDVQLDAVIQSIVQNSPNSGQVMMRGALLGRGLRIQRRRIRESMLRVDPAGTECRRRLRIKRRVYNVPGPNSLR
jgi:hypothetical protein